MALSTKQKSVLAYIRQHGRITTDEAVTIIGGDYFGNASFHVGAVLSRMVKSKLVRREKRGVFAAPIQSGLFAEHPIAL